MRPRVIVLTALDPQGRFGLACDVRALYELGAEPIPISTAVFLGEPGEDVRLMPQPARLVESALTEALERHCDGMLVGLVPRYLQTRALARILTRQLPDTLVYAPLTPAFDARPFLGKVNRRSQVRAVLPEATTVVAPAQQAGALLEEAEDLEAEDLARRLRRRGAHSVWLTGTTMYGRQVDVVAHGDEVGLIDYPAVGDEAEPHLAGAALAALLAKGVGLVEAVDRAHRYANALGRHAYPLKT